MTRICMLLALSLPAAFVAPATTIYDATVLGNGPTAFFPLDETTGTVANNLANSMENGTYHGNVVLGIPGGPDGSGAGFTPIGPYASAPNYAGIDATSAFSIEAWVNVSSAGANALGTIAAINRALDSTGLALWLNGDHPELGLNNGSNFAELSTGSVTNGAWNQIVVSWNENASGGAPQFYINGALVGNTDANGLAQGLNLNNALGFNIAAEFPDKVSSAGRWFNGDIEDVSFYNYALTAGQVSADYAAAAPEPSSWLLIGLGLSVMAAIGRKRVAR